MVVVMNTEVDGGTGATGEYDGDKVDFTMPMMLWAMMLVEIDDGGIWLTASSERQGTCQCCCPVAQSFAAMLAMCRELLITALQTRAASRTTSHS